MSTRFNGKRTIKLPPVCHKELYDLPPAYEAGLPTSLSVLAIWFELAFGWTICESFRLVEDHGVPGWCGHSGTVGLNLHVDVKRTGVPHVYDLLLSVRQNYIVQDDDSWHAIQIGPGPPFNSGLQTHLWAWPTDYTRLQVTD